MEQDGWVSPNGKRIFVGPSALQNAGWLAGNLYHEVEIHVNRQYVPGYVYFGENPASWMNEVHAHSMTLHRSMDFKMSWSDIRETDARQQTYMRHIHEYYRSR